MRNSFTQHIGIALQIGHIYSTLIILKPYKRKTPGIAVGVIERGDGAIESIIVCQLFENGVVTDTLVLYLR